MAVIQQGNKGLANMERITIIGAGLMGHGIAQIFALHGHPVCLVDDNQEVLNSAKNRVHSNLTNMAEQGVKLNAGVQEILDRIEVTLEMQAACENSDYVFEAVFEDLELKQRIFADLDQITTRIEKLQAALRKPNRQQEQQQ